MFSAHGTRTFVQSAVALLGAAISAFAGGHTWRVNEIFSNADGTIQFIEVKESLGGAGETATAGHNVTSNTRSFTITSNVTAPTSFRTLLLATPGFVGLPGAPTPDYVFPAGSVPFLSTAGDTIRYVPYCTYTFGAGILPTDGVNSITINTHEAHAITIGPNSPTNYAGQTGSINVGCTDLDGDGYGNPGNAACPNGPATDCDDGNNMVSPGAAEVCDDTIDNDCDTLVDCMDGNDCLGTIPACPAVSPLVGVALTVLLVGAAGFVLKPRPEHE